jgi:hypothetical protein
VGGTTSFFVRRKGAFLRPGWFCFATGGGRVKVTRSVPAIAGCLDAAEHGARIESRGKILGVDGRVKPGHDAETMDCRAASRLAMTWGGRGLAQVLLVSRDAGLRRHDELGMAGVS